MASAAAASDSNSSSFEQLLGEGRRIDADEAKRLIASDGKVFFNNRICPFGHRAFWTAAETGYLADVDYIHIDLGPTKPEWYQEIVNPFGTVPALFVDGKPVFESLVVAAYINKVASGGLVPTDPQQEAAMNVFVARFGDRLTGNLYRVLSNQDATKAQELLQTLQDRAKEIDDLYLSLRSDDNKEGPFFGGSSLTLGDIAVLPFVDRFSIILKHYRGVDILPFMPNLAKAYRAALERPAFQKSRGNEQFYIAAYSRYANGTKAFSTLKKPTSTASASAGGCAASGCCKPCACVKAFGLVAVGVAVGYLAAKRGCCL